MQPEFESKVKMERHLTNIRRDARHRILQQRRNEMYFETQSISKIAADFSLPYKQAGQYTILEVLGLCYQEILHVGSTLNHMIEQRSSHQNVATIGAHVNFWAYFLQEFFTERIRIDQKLEAFFIQFLNTNSYRVLAGEKMLQLKVLNTLEVAIATANDANKLKSVSLKWVAGTDGLTLIYNSLPNHFLCPYQYANVYEVTKQSLKFYNFEKVAECCEIVKQIMKGADKDDTYRIYTEQSDLMVYLLSSLSRYVEDHSIETQADAVIYLMDSYNTLIFDYARMGVALLGTCMIICRRESNVLKGLEIIKFISEVEDSNAIKFLLEDRELNEAGLWHTIFSTDQILMSTKISVKREAYTIFANMMCNGDYNCLSILNGKIQEQLQQQLIDLINYGLKMEDDITILRSLLTMLSVLIYYSQNFSSDSQSEGEEDEKFHARVVQKIIQLELEQDVRKLTMHKNSELAESAGKLCNSIEFIVNPVSTA